MKTALYTRPGWQPKIMRVIAEHEDKTVDLGTVETGEMRFEGVPVADEPAEGFCVLIEGEDSGTGSADESRAEPQRRRGKKKS